MRRLYFVSDGPMDSEVLMNALSGYGRQRLDLSLESWAQIEKTDECGKELPVKADYAGRITLLVDRFSRLVSESDPRRAIPGGVPVVNLFAEVGDLEIFEPRRFEQDNPYQELKAGMRVKILYDYAGGFGVIANATGREFDAVTTCWQRWSILPIRHLYVEARLKNSKERKTLAEYQRRLKKLNLPAELILNENIMEALRMT